MIAGPPKAGNVWLKCLLGHIYELRPLTKHETPKRPLFHHLKAWVEGDNFPDGTIFHQHYDYREELVDLIDAIPAHTVTIIRDPYDGFVSSYFTIQQHKDDGFRNNIRRALEWKESGRTHVVRYEQLHANPIDELRAVTDVIQPVPDERIA